MLREMIEKEVSALKHAAHAMREWIHPRVAMKNPAFDRPLDDLGQTIDDVERRAEPQEPQPPKGAPPP
jgi:hypothetical protein